MRTSDITFVLFQARILLETWRQITLHYLLCIVICPQCDCYYVFENREVLRLSMSFGVLMMGNVCW